MNPFSYFGPHLKKTLNKAILTTNMFTGKCGICGDMPPKGRFWDLESVTGLTRDGTAVVPDELDDGSRPRAPRP